MVGICSAVDLVVNVSSMHPEPVLQVRVGECSKGERHACDLNRLTSWYMAEATLKGSRAEGSGRYSAVYTVSFPDYSRGMGAHILYMRVEYSSASAALRSLNVATKGEPSFIGARIQGGWPLFIPATGLRAELGIQRQRLCKPGESFQGRGRWVRTLPASSRRQRQRLGRPKKSLTSTASWMSCEGDAQRDWRWEPDGCEPRRVTSRKQARTCLQERGGIKLMGDSILHQVAEQLGCGLGSSNREKAIADVADPAEREDEVFARYWRIKGPVPKRLPTVESILRDYADNVTRGRVRGGGVLVLNVAGLWQAAYGDLDEYEEAVDRVVAIAASAPFSSVVLWLTTAVHPIHFLSESDAAADAPILRTVRPSISGADAQSNYQFRRGEQELEAGDFATARLRKYALAKRAMTQVRVNALVDMEKLAASRHRLHVFDSSNMTLSREDDPFKPSDMRHYGHSTIAELAELLLASICSRPRESARVVTHSNVAHAVPRKRWE